MGDTPSGSLPPSDLTNTYRTSGSSEPELRRSHQEMPQTAPRTPNYPAAQPPPAQQYHGQQRPDAFNLTGLGGALPDTAYQNYQQVQQRQVSGHSPATLVYPIQNPSQFGSLQSQGQPVASASYPIQYQGQYQGMYPASHIQSPPQIQSPPIGGQFFQGQGYMGQPQLQNPQFYMQSTQYPPQNLLYHAPSLASQYGMRGNFPADNRQGIPQLGNEYLGAGSGSARSGRPGSIASSAGNSSVVRGPPRKPRQSGHAIWIGNLPPQTELMNLVLHVCKETEGLESIFLISKSNCAFANFKDEVACTAAQAKIHDSRFQTVRLVSRLRRSSIGTAVGIVAPTGPAALSPPSMPPVARSPSPVEELSSKEKQQDSVDGQEGPDDESAQKDKFFIVKSLTVEDLELSVRNGIWATQSHNEHALNKAYQSADNVYLIFSANKSGEYFGYARMISPINDDPAAAIEFAPQAQSVEDPGLPKAIPTPATEFAPKGRIIDDSARGTIFWEVERDETEADEEDESRSNRSDQEVEAPISKAWGKPFKIEWLSTMRLPFYRTRGLRNPWNSNREVKIARDGTELENAVGRKLIGLFHRLPSSAAPQMPGAPLAMMDGYPRPFP